VLCLDLGVERALNYTKARPIEAEGGEYNSEEMRKSPRIGIPRALLYYEYYPMWKTFFERLGAEIVVSPPTDRGMLISGSSRVVAETCLPVKVFMGHVLSLVDKCDYLFVPAIRSMEAKIHNCSKFLGLPDMTKAVIPECPPILDTDIDVDKGKRELYQAIYKLGRNFTYNLLKVKQAAEAAWQVHQSYQTQMYFQCQTPLQAMEEIFLDLGEERGKGADNSNLPLSIAFIGHPYLLYDEYVNYRLLSRLEGMGVKVLTPEMVDRSDLSTVITKIAGGRYWTYENEVVGAGGYYLESKVDGVIGLATFSCGPDSLMMDIVQRHAKRLRKPFMLLTLDEHTAETGLLTRLEAFLDMIWRGKRGKE
jgi:predicted nucleotide-binding protein (sugar kinase/HSP70/actin superfamily)